MCSSLINTPIGRLIFIQPLFIMFSHFWQGFFIAKILIFFYIFKAPFEWDSWFIIHVLPALVSDSKLVCSTYVGKCITYSPVIFTVKSASGLFSKLTSILLAQCEIQLLCARPCKLIKWLQASSSILYFHII